MIVTVTTSPTLIKTANVPCQLFIQNTGTTSVSITPDGSPGGTSISTGQTLILAIQNPLRPTVSVWGSVSTGTTTLDVQEWPF